MISMEALCGIDLSEGVISVVWQVALTHSGLKTKMCQRSSVCYLKCQVQGAKGEISLGQR